MWTPMAGSSSQEALILDADYLLLIVWLGLQQSHWWISFWAIILSTVFCQPSRNDFLFLQMKLHSQTVRVSPVLLFPKAKNTQSCRNLKLGPLHSKTVRSLTNPSLGVRLNLICCLGCYPLVELCSIDAVAFCDLCLKKTAKFSPAGVCCDTGHSFWYPSQIPAFGRKVIGSLQPFWSQLQATGTN